MRPLGRIGYRHELAEIGFISASDETLGAVDNVVITLPHRARFHRSRVGTRVGLGLHEAKLLFSPEDGIEKPLFLIIVQRVQNRSDFRAEDSSSTRRQRDRATHLLPYQHLR